MHTPHTQNLHHTSKIYTAQPIPTMTNTMQSMKRSVAMPEICRRIEQNKEEKEMTLPSGSIRDSAYPSRNDRLFMNANGGKLYR